MKNTHAISESSSDFRRHRLFRMRLITSGLILALVAISGLAKATEQEHAGQPCKLPLEAAAGLAADDGISSQAIDDYKGAIALLLDEEKFAELNCLADSLRSSKEQFAAGVWKIHTLYAGVEKPLLHATPEDWTRHMKLVNAWVAAQPKSITARVAVAESYIQYGWYARGAGFSDSVSKSGWELFEERMAQARQVLEEASALQTKCPEWYFAMQQIALAQRWDRKNARALFERAFKVEPSYYYFARMHAQFLQPRWYGEAGDSEKFLQEAADRVGGDAGDILYFQVANNLICGCEDDDHTHLSWPRIQKGFATLEKQHGTSLLNLNLLAHMAVAYQDAVVADKSFTQIGVQWSAATWQQQSYFDSSKKWAAQMAPMMAAQRSMEDSAAANMQTAEGARYNTIFEQRIKELMEPCPRPEQGDSDKAELLIRIGKDGVIERMMTVGVTSVSNCLMQKLADFRMKNAPAFPPPPQPAYWLRLDLDPAIYTPVASN